MRIQGNVFDCVFLILQELIHSSILSFIRENECIIDLSGGRFTVKEKCNQPITMKMCVLDAEEEIVSEIERKLEGIKGIGVKNIADLRKILIQNRELFRKSPGRIGCYVHEFK